MTEDIVNLNYIIGYYSGIIYGGLGERNGQCITNLPKIIFMETLQVIQYSYNIKVDVSVQQMKSTKYKGKYITSYM